MRYFLKIAVLAFVMLLYPKCKLFAQQDTVSLHVDVESVVVSARHRTVSTIDANGNVSINMESLSSLPRFGGAVDVVKLLQYTPGVGATTGGNASMFVRGGDAGQNRFVLDGAPIYSPSHLFGFFSVINSAHLSGLTLYKSHIPASYGSAVSSITELRTHTVVPPKIGVEGNLGIIEADIAAQLPLGDRCALYATARHSYASWLISLISSENSDVSLGYEFGDYGVGMVADLGRAGMLHLNTHFNRDRVRMGIKAYDSSGDVKWWNGLTSAILTTQLSERVQLQNRVYSSIFDNTLCAVLAGNSFAALSALADYGASSSVEAKWYRVVLNGGVQYSYRRITPQYLQTELMPEVAGDGEVNDTHEISLYADVQWSIHRHLELNAGLRLSGYRSDNLWVYPEPRLMLTVPLTSNNRLWAGYDFMVQYMHLVPQSNTSFASDFYAASTHDVPPQLSHNFNVGYAHTLLHGALNLSVEAFYRRMMGVIEYDTRLSSMVAGGDDYLDTLYSGDGETYGVECAVGYSARRVNLQLNYTLARSMRWFDEINGGEPFPAVSDRRHNLSMLVSYEPTPRWSLAATFVYASGSPYTAPDGIYMAGGSFIKEYGAYNGARLPDLHHLDLSVTYWFKSKKLRRSGINLSIYNVYSRKNPLMISWAVYRDDNNDNIIHISERQHALFEIVPSLSWTFKF